MASWPATASAISPLTLPTALRDALAAVGVAAVAQLGGFELAGGGTGGDRGAPVRARAQGDLHLDGGVAAGIKDLACVDRFDLAHNPGARYPLRAFNRARA